jgi:phage terminase large subunit-like protein
MVFPLDDGFYAVVPKFWVPELNARQRERRDKVPYETWARQGLVELTPGDVVDQSYIRKRINELNQTYELKQLAIDRWNAGKISTELIEDGFNVVMFGQGFASMNAPSKKLETLLIGHKLIHFGNPVLRWMAGNAAAETDAAGNVKPSKKKSTEKIDGIVGLVMGLGVEMTSNTNSGSVYNDRGIIAI